VLIEVPGAGTTQIDVDLFKKSSVGLF